MRIMILLMCILLSSCKIPYKSDVGFVSDGHANYPSVLMSINGKNCNGICGVALKKGQSINIKLLALGVNYKVHVLTSENYGYSEWFDVLGNEEFNLLLPGSNLDVLNLMVRIYRADAIPNVHTFAEARIRLFHEEHIRKSQPYITNGFLILGEDSLYLNCDGKTYIKATTIKSDKCRLASVESFMGRVAHYGISE